MTSPVRGALTACSQPSSWWSVNLRLSVPLSRKRQKDKGFRLPLPVNRRLTGLSCPGRFALRLYPANLGTVAAPAETADPDSRRDRIGLLDYAFLAVFRLSRGTTIMPPRDSFTTRPVYMGRRGLIAAGHYLAARAGQRMFDK